MNVVTSGHVNISTFRLEQPVDIDELLVLMQADPYESPGSTGWGGIVVREGGADTIGRLRSSPGAPRITESFGTRAIFARRLADHYDYHLARQFGEELLESLPPEYTHRLEIRFLRGRNEAGKRSDFRDTADTDRADLLALIAQQTASFGMCKFQVLHKGLDLEVDMQLNADGSFSPFVGTSWYRREIERPGGWTIRLAMDVANTVIPDLYSAHEADHAWPRQRETFREQARNRVGELLS